jgi:hypothetical protein
VNSPLVVPGAHACSNHPALAAQEVPLLPATYFVPGSSLHAILFFLPTLLMGSGAQWWLMLSCLAAGPVSGMVYSSRGMATYQFEW